MPNYDRYIGAAGVALQSAGTGFVADAVIVNEPYLATAGVILAVIGGALTAAYMFLHSSPTPTQ